MAAEDRPPAHHLSYLLDAAGDSKKFGLFAIVRGAEARAPHLPRIGRARRPEGSVVDLAQVPTLAFPDSTLSEVAVRGDRATAYGYWLGLTGAMGPLPSHLTEFADFERRYAKARPFGQWLDLLANRMLQFFYRAWADSQPAAHVDRPDEDAFGRYLARLTGSDEGVAADAAFPARARVHYAGLLASRRSAVGIEDALSHLLGQPVRLLEYQPRWRDIEPDDQTRLGRSFAGLGSDAMAGKRARVASDAFRIVVRANTMREFEALLPSSDRFAIISEALDAFTPSHLEWDVAVELPEREARAARLDGRARLGWTGWLQPGKSDRIRSDAHLRRRRAKRAANT